MTDFRLHSVASQQDILLISPLPSSDICVVSWADQEFCQAAKFRIRGMSCFDGWMPTLPPQSFFLRMVKDKQHQFPLADMIEVTQDLSPEKNAAILTFKDDENVGYLSVIKTQDNILGVQTFQENWRDIKPQVKPIWLGRTDLGTKSSQLLECFFTEAVELIDKWMPRGKPIHHIQRSLAALVHPEIPQNS